MHRKLLFALATFFITILAFAPSNATAQMTDRDNSMESQGLTNNQTPNDNQELNDDFSVPAEAGNPAEQSNRNQGLNRSDTMERNVVTPSEQGRSVASSDQPSRGGAPVSSRNNQQDQNLGTVTRIDKPDGCLRIRAEATSSSDIVGCAKMGEKLQLSGKFSSDGRWAQLADKGWVFSSQIDAPNKPQVRSQARRSTDSGMYYSEPSDSSIWQEPAGTSYYYGPDYDYSVPYYGRGPGIGFSWGGRGRHGGHGWQGGGHSRHGGGHGGRGGGGGGHHR
jgi:hypothetical protein